MPGFMLSGRIQRCRLWQEPAGPGYPGPALGTTPAAPENLVERFGLSEGLQRMVAFRAFPYLREKKRNGSHQGDGAHPSDEPLDELIHFPPRVPQDLPRMT